MKATFENKDNMLWPGLSVSTRLLLKTLKQVIVVPEDAIGHGPSGLYAYVVGDGNKVALRAVKVSQEGDGQTVVTDGLSPGEKVVISGQYQLQQDTAVEPAQAMADNPVPRAAGRNETAQAR
jgi:membrane fusion protein, multidrug efflux system